MRIAVLTSNGARHLAFAARLAEVFDVVGVFTEAKTFDPSAVYQSPEEQALLEGWFTMRAEAEEAFFGARARTFEDEAGALIGEVPAGTINDPACVARLRNLAPEAVAVFGSSILRKPLLDLSPGHFVNMHLGLSPYYRGSGTNFWPFYNEELEYVGVTIHWIDAGIDSGSIIHQGRPTIAPGDNPHTIGCKAMIVGVDLMVQALHEIERGTVAGVPQRKDLGKLYRRKDFSARHVAAVFEKLEAGLIERYAQQTLPPVDLVP